MHGRARKYLVSSNNSLRSIRRSYLASVRRACGVSLLVKAESFVGTSRHPEWPAFLLARILDCIWPPICEFREKIVYSMRIF